MNIQTKLRSGLLASLFVVILGLLPAKAQTNVQRVHSFGGTLPGEGHGPVALALAENGIFYGITGLGGPGNRGSIFRLSEDETVRTTIHLFGTNSMNGRNPKELIYGSDGLLYGLASGGSNSVGVLFSIQTSGLNYTILRHMTNTPASLVEGSDGRLYFAENGIRRIEKSGANYQAISAFSASGLIEANDGMLYAFDGFTTIRKIAKDGSSEVDIITTFPPDELGVDPDEVSHLRQGADGFLYGLASELAGGTGYFFRTDTNGANRAQSRFTGAAGSTDPTSFFQSTNDGLFYVSVSGSAGYRGGLFVVSTNFTGSVFNSTNLLTWPAITGGEFGALTKDHVTPGPDGLLYGVTDFAGNNFAGLLFRLERTGSNFNSLLHFSVDGPTDGTNAAPPMIVATNGLLYGTTRNGGLNNRGVIYRLKPDGTGYSVVKQFATDAEGIDPAGGVVDGKDGFLYGATVAGGSQNLGTVYKLRYDGSQFTVMYNIRTNRPGATTPQDPSFCAGTLLSDANGWLFGVGLTGGSAGRGGIFAARKDGSQFTNIHNFIVGEARRPFAGLIEGQDGKLYGVTENGGANDAGVFYRMNKDGSAFQILRAFGGGTDGVNPDGPLWQDSDGVLYGTTFGGGSNGFGTAFKINPDGTGYTVIRHFGAGVDGRRPTCALVPGPNDTLLGTTRFGGSGPVGGQFGTIFQMSKDGLSYQVLRSFTGTAGDGGGLFAGLAAASSNNFFVGTSFGGDLGIGTIHRLTFTTANPALIAATPQGVDATIQCGQAFTFTAPTYSGGCPPLTITSNLVVSGSSCAQTNRVTWIASDSCGQSVTNIQTIVVTDSTPPSVVTPAGTNTIVNCGDAFVFTAPTYADACSGVANVASNLVTIGVSCPQTNIVTWVATDACGNSTTNTQTIIISAPATPVPQITTQPVSVIGQIGHVATLTVDASSPGLLTYAWRFNGGDLSGETNNVLGVVISPSTAGAYSVRVTGPGGSTNSSTVSVTLFTINADRTLSLTGATGALHRLEFADALTNAPQFWQTLTNTTLPNGSFELLDSTAPAAGRFYRAVKP